MVVDGNDERGIDVGIMSRLPITAIHSHVDDLNAEGNRIFSRDCPEYEIALAGGQSIVILPNHPAACGLSHRPPRHLWNGAQERQDRLSNLLAAVVDKDSDLRHRATRHLPSQSLVAVRYGHRNIRRSLRSSMRVAGDGTVEQVAGGHLTHPNVACRLSAALGWIWKSTLEIPHLISPRVSQTIVRSIVLG
jgi:hypothetical protein